MANVTYILELKDKVSRIASKMQNRLNGVTKSAQRSGGALSSLQGIVTGALAVGFFKAGAELEAAQLKFNTLAGSVEKGTKLFDNLTQFANTTPFQDDRLNKNASTLLAFGSTAESIVPTLRMLGDVAAGDQNTLDSLTLAFAQIKSTGHLMGQDLLQLINAGFNPLQIISEKTGKSMAELKKAMSKGKISFKAVELAFKAATSKGGRFHNLTNKMADTMLGRWSTAMGKGKRAIQELSLTLKPVFLPLINQAIEAIGLIQRFVKDNKALIVRFVEVGIKVIALVGAVKLLRITFVGLWKVIAKNPIGVVIIALAALDEAIASTQKNAFSFTTRMKLWWAELKLGGRTIANIFKQLGGILSSFFESLGFLLRGQIKESDVLWNKMISQFKNFELASKESQRQYDKDVLKIINSAKKLEKIKTPEFQGAGAGAFDFNFDEELKKLTAQGIVSGGRINTFNVNINRVVGAENINTTTITEAGGAAGQSVANELLKALADITPR